MSPKVSVVMSVYNEEKYLDKAVTSILRQDFTDFEFIIINDGSTDRSQEILRSSNDKRIVLINQENVGQTRSLNKGLEIAKGKYIARMDADDIALPDRLRKQVEFLEENPDVALVGSSVILINENGKEIGACKAILDNARIQKELLKHNCFFHGSVLFRRKAIDAVGHYNEEFRYSQDYDLWLRIAERFEVANINEPLLKRRMKLFSPSISMKHIQDEYAVLAIHLAEHRRKAELNGWSDHVLKISNFSNIPSQMSRNRQTLSRNFFYWARYLDLNGNPTESLRLMSKAIFYNPFNINAWRYLGSMSIRQLKKLTRLGLNILKRI